MADYKMGAVVCQYKVCRKIWAEPTGPIFSFPVNSADITVIAIIPNHIIAPVGDMGAHGGKPFTGITHCHFGHG